MHDPTPAPLDEHLPAAIRKTLEERFWRAVEEGSTLETLGDDPSLATAADRHPALFADHGVVHARNVAAGVLELAGTIAGVLLPERPPERQAFVLGLGVILSYLHDVGMSDPSPTGRRLHALVAAQLPFSGALDDVIDELLAGGGAVVRRIEAVGADAPFAVPADVVLRELCSLGVAHSKSAVPGELLGDHSRLRAAMQRAVLVDLEGQARGGAATAEEPGPPEPIGRAARWYRDPLRDSFAWLGGPAAAQRALTEDAIDAIRLTRAADALRQRGTSLRTAAGYEIFIDADTGAAVFALRSHGGEHLVLLRADSPLSAGEANLRSATVTPRGDLRIAFHRGRFPSPSARVAACTATARVAVDVVEDVLGAFAFREPSRDLPGPRLDGAAQAVQLERPADEPSFAEEVADEIERRAPHLAPRLAVVADLESAAPLERSRYHRGAPVPAGSAEARTILAALAEHGLNVDAVDVEEAFEDVRRVGLEPGETLVEAGSPPAFVYVATTAGLRVRPLGGYADADVPAWVPVGITGVVRRAERNSLVVALAPVEVLMIPGELFTRAWFRPYRPAELAGLLEGILPA